MTWNDLADAITKMPARRRVQPVVFVSDYFGPDRQPLDVDLVRAFEDVYVGITVGNECLLGEGDYFLADAEEDVGAGPR